MKLADEQIVNSCSNKTTKTLQLLHSIKQNTNQRGGGKKIANKGEKKEKKGSESERGLAGEAVGNRLR